MIKKDYINWGVGNAGMQGKEFVFNQQEFENFKKETTKPKNTAETIFDQATTGIGDLVQSTIGGLYGLVGGKKETPIQVEEQNTVIAPILDQKSKVDNEYNALQSTLKGNEKALELQKNTGKRVLSTRFRG